MNAKSALRVPGWNALKLYLGVWNIPLRSLRQYTAWKFHSVNINITITLKENYFILTRSLNMKSVRNNYKYVWHDSKFSLCTDLGLEIFSQPQY